AATRCRLAYVQKMVQAFWALAAEAGVAVINATHSGTELPPQRAMAEGLWRRGLESEFVTASPNDETLPPPAHSVRLPLALYAASGNASSTSPTPPRSARCAAARRCVAVLAEKRPVRLPTALLRTGTVAGQNVLAVGRAG